MNFLRGYQPLKFGRVWIWFFFSRWQLGRSGLIQAFNVGPLFIDWYPLD